MVNEVHLAYYQLILFIIFLLGFLFSGNLLFFLFCLVSLYCFLLLTIKIKNYAPILYHLVSVPILVVQGILLVYIYLFNQNLLQYTPSKVLIYLFTVIWIGIVSYYIYHTYKSYKKGR